MSGESTDSECSPIDKTKRSRSLLRQFRATLVGKSSNRHRAETTDASLSVSLLREKHRSFDNIDIENFQRKSCIKKTSKTTTPISYSHRLSLLNQVKSHIIGNRKYRRTVPPTWTDDDDDYLSFTSVNSNSETKLSSTNGDHQNGVASSPSDPLINTPEPLSNSSNQNGHEKTMVLNDSLNMSVEDDKQQHQTNELNRALNSSRASLNKFKDQLTQRAKTVMPKTQTISSMFAAPPPVDNPDQVYWTEICIERGIELSVKDISGTSDPYVKVCYGTEEKYTTNAVTKNLNPIWNEKFTIFTHDLNIPLYFNVFDRDRIGRDESMGSAKLDLWKLPFDRLYNASLELENEKRSDGKNGLVKVSVTITPKTVEFRDEVLRNLAKQSQTKSFFGGRSGANSGVILPRRTIDVFIIEGRKLALNGVNKTCSPYVRVKFGTKKYRTQTIKSTLNPKWHQSFMFDTTFGELHPIELTVFDDSSSSGDFLGRGICNLAHLDEERTHRIPVDLEDNAGIIDVFITITQTTALQEATNDGDSSANTALDVMPSKLTNEEINHYKFFSTLRSLNPIFDVGKLEIKIYQARDLSAKDLTGKSDPFCIVELDSSRLRTHTIYKTLNPVWNKSFVIPVQDIHSVVELTIYDEDTNKSNEFIGKVAIPLLSINNGEKKWMVLKNQKCITPVKGAIEIEATFVYTNLKAVLRTFNPRQVPYYQIDDKFSVGAIKQSVSRIQNMLSGVVNVFKFLDHCFQWENPWLSFGTFMATLVIVWNFEVYMLPLTLLIFFARNAVSEYRSGRLGKPYASLADETIAAVVQAAPVDDEVLEAEANTKEEKKSFLGVIASIQETIMEIQGVIDGVASTLERIKNLFNYTIPWLSILLIILLHVVAVLLYYVPLRFLILAFVINKFTKRFRKPKGFIDNNELADFMSRLPSDPEIMKYRQLKVIPRSQTIKKNKRSASDK